MDAVTNTPPLFGEVFELVEGGKRKISVTGLWGSSKALFLWELAARAGLPVLVLSPTAKEAEALFGDYRFFASQAASRTPAAYFPPWDVLPYDVISPDPAVVSQRLKVLSGIAHGEIKIAVTPVKAFMQRLAPPEALFGDKAEITIIAGADLPHDPFMARLVEMGYTHTPTVYEPGEFSVRGGILDIFPPGADNPARIEFFGDTVESIRAFDTDTQRSLATTSEVAILATRECGTIADTLGADLASYFSMEPLVVVDEPGRVASQASDFEGRVFSAYEEAVSDTSHPRPETMYMTAAGLEGRIDGLTHIKVESLPVQSAEQAGEAVHYQTRSVEGLRLRDTVPEPWPEELPKTPIAIFCRNLRRLSAGYSVNVAVPTAGQSERLGEIFAEYGVPAEKGVACLVPAGASPTPSIVRIATGELSSGFLMDGPGLAFITSRDIFGEAPRHAPAPRAKVERFLTSLSELNPGDFVVHVEHGIGRYQGMKRLKLMGVESDFLDVLYQGSDRLYVPVDELGKLQKYIGAEGGASAHLDRLGGVAWERAKARAKKAVEEMAKELLELYAARAVAPGHACSPDDHLYREMETAFEYEETPDQAQAIVEVKKDLEGPHPMDRLVCGDVGYGKTEVAIRAAFKVVLDGKQAAVLVPTTLLARQHHQTFSARLAAFPVRVEMLSRFTPKVRVKEIVRGLSDGTVDIVIGTHRLLQKDISFGDLGLLVVDEEHRFGVKHKEKLKALRKQVDVLTLTATPIPRTLHMSIAGIRDLSVIETPPPDRLPIKTIVTRYDRAVIKEAVTRELARGGQVFFVHNRIDSIYSIAENLQGILPDIKMAVAHGRMHEEELERVMTGFIEGGYDLLLTTSIIESGLDIPNANTIIINRADRFGLADLYQLRGRVGRSGVRAYAYLLVPGEGGLTETAEKRLRVLSELTELGAGFKLALHDLEIRGAGNILGPEQSGHIAAIGFDLYTQMLEDAVRGLRGEAVEEAVDPAMNLKVSAYIPDGYVPDTAHRLGIYKRLAGTRSPGEVEDMRAELADRYGPIPEEAERLLQVMELKVLARILKAAGVEILPTEARITFTDKVDIPPDRLLEFLRARRGRARYVPEYTLFIKRPPGSFDALYLELKNSLKELAQV